MARDETVPVDIDRLADYIGGALDGTDHDEVTRLVADDPQWRETYELLVPGMDAAATGLHSLGARPEPMPDEIAARLDEALTASPRLTVIPGGVDDSDLEMVPRPRRSRRVMRWAAPIAVAAGVLAFAGFGMQWVTGGQLDEAPTSSQAGGAAADQDSGASEAEPAPMLDNSAPGNVSLYGGVGSLQSSGTNYTAATLGTLGASAQRAATSSDGNDEAEKSAELAAAPPALARLSSPTALNACIEAILAQRTGGTAGVESIDLAAYEGLPAVIVRVSDDESTWVYAAGPDCGTPERGADVRNQVQVR